VYRSDFWFHRGSAMSKGRKKPKLRDLSVDPLTYDEQILLINALSAAATPISIAILGAVLVEHELDVSLRERLRISNDAEWQTLVDERGPFSSFSRKIAVGHALRIYREDFRENLDIIRAVRNAFAHSRRIIDFSHPLVGKELNSIRLLARRKRAFRKAIKKPPHQCYVDLCCLLSTELVRKRMLASDRSMKRSARKYASSPLYKALAPTLGLGSFTGVSNRPILGLASLGSTLPPPPDGHTARPNQRPQLGLLSGLFAGPPKNDDKKDT
jgi:hypothetical protein